MPSPTPKTPPSLGAYYNEIDAYAAQWLRNLIARGLIAPGEVDERSIADVRPDDLRGFRQCHFFAGIGVWSLALRRAGWDNDREVWTGSCPCQAHSSAARGRLVARDWWPVWKALILARRPRVVFGEQVASATRWLAQVRTDLEDAGYAVGAANLSALGVGADHIRARYYFAGDTDGDGQSGVSVDAEAPWLSRARGEPRVVLRTDGSAARVAQLRAFGNALHAGIAHAFVESYRAAREACP